MNPLQHSPIAINYDALAFVHLILNGFLFAICFCRLAKMHKGVLRRVKAQYVMLLAGSAANGFAPIFFSQWPSVVSVIFTALVLYVMWSDSYAWKHGVPHAALQNNPDAKVLPEVLDSHDPPVKETPNAH
jgi:hypothetical protein